MPKPILLLLHEHLSVEQLLQYKDHKILMLESYHELNLHKHHKKKLVFFIASMRHFYQEIKDEFDVEYLASDESVCKAICSYGMKNGHAEVHMIRPGEYRVYQEVMTLCKELGLKFVMHEDSKFMCTINEFCAWSAKAKGKLLMENFYRQMRKQTSILMEGGKPAEGKWNFDKENRKPLKGSINPPNLRLDQLDDVVREVIILVEDKFGQNFGDIHPFYLEVTRKGAERALRKFLDTSLSHFGPYQDAMQTGEELLFHSALSAYLNIGFLQPRAVCDLVEQYYRAGKVAIQSAEGFIRQILGWREFIRGIYWTHMPEYKSLNHMNYRNKLPDFYWTGQTDCNCIKHVVEFTRKYAYSHHIQRLMVTGNFAALLGVMPEEICEWYLCVYADAYEWVELPNTLGMATYSDGGIVGTKPYIGSGAYINKMSDFCKGCRYKWDERVGPNACPFNSLYWNYLIKHEDKLRSNHRMSIPYSVLDKMQSTEQIVSQAEKFVK